MSASENRTSDNWHLSKSVPLGLIFGLIAQGGAIVWTASMMMSDIERNRSSIDRVDLLVTLAEDLMHEQSVAIGRIDENIKAIRDYVELITGRGEK